ncbi:MAG: hypothetical protein ACKVWR_03265 [Acidimicrobiales bacterium]
MRRRESIVVESPFEIRVGAIPATVLPETLDNVTVVLVVLHRTALSARALRSGFLEVGLQGGGRIDVPH